MEEASTTYVNSEFLARFRELFSRTEDQSGDQDSVSWSQNQPLLPTGPLPDARFSASLNPNTIWAWSVLRNEESLPGTNGQHNVNSYPAISLPDPDTQETGMDYSEQIKSMQLNHVIGMALEFSGSWFLRNALAENNTESTSIIFDGLIGYILNLAIHPSGCNVLVSLTQVCNADQLSQIIRNLILPPSRLIQVSLNITGSKTIRRLIQLLKRSCFIDPVVTALASGFHELMEDQHGALVIHRCLAQLNSQQNEVLYRAAISPCVALAAHIRGCVELNSFINSVSGPYRDHLLHTITDKTVFLSQDPRGNFVIQHILDLQHPVFTKKICSQLQGYYVRLSFQKSGSHVVEKCLKSSDMSFAVLDLTSSTRLAQVAHDQFGNYVIQTALKVTQDKDRLLYGYLRKALEPHLEILASHLHGKNVFKLIKDAPPM